VNDDDGPLRDEVSAEEVERLVEAAGPGTPDRPPFGPEGAFGPPSPPPDAGGFTLEEVIREIDAEYTAARGVPAKAAAPEKPAAPAAASQTEDLVLFTLGESAFAVPTANVREVGRAPAVTPLPNVPDWLRGVTNLRGDILSVVDLKTFLRIPRSGEPARMLVVASSTDELTTALLVDAVPGRARLAAGARQPAEALASPAIAPYAVGLNEHRDRLVTVLDLDKILRAPDLQQFQGA